LVWGITQRGHDHDIADYEIYLWEVGTSPEKAVRLTHNSGNDRWPDIFIPSAASAAPAPPTVEADDAPKEAEEQPKAASSKKKRSKGKP
jgi:hypothetical protein